MSRNRLALAGASLAMVACAPSLVPDDRAPDGDDWLWDLPDGFPVPLVPADNPMSRAKVELGRRLFHDPRLSGNGELSCAGCHRPELAYTDGRARAIGATGEVHPRSAMSLANVAYNATLGWDDPEMTRLEDQAFVPLASTHPVEMGIVGREDEVVARLRGDPAVQRGFRAAFPDDADPVTLANAVRAIAAFERTLISGGSPYDRWAYGGDPDALGADARAGAALFFSNRLACFRCHAGFNLSGPVVHEGSPASPPRFHHTGLYDVDGTGAYPEPNTGVHRHTGDDADRGRFRAPTLRNIARTAPYMHDGSVPTLEAVLEHYAAGGRAHADGSKEGAERRDALVRGFDLDREERDRLIAFLHALTDEAFLERAVARAP